MEYKIKCFLEISCHVSGHAYPTSLTACMCKIYIQSLTIILYDVYTTNRTCYQLDGGGSSAVVAGASSAGGAHTR